MAAEATGKQDLTWVWITLAAVAIIGFFIFHQSIAAVKTAPITLVPTGSQAAINPNTYPLTSGAYYNPSGYPGDQAAWASSDAASNQAYAQSDQNIAIANATADVLTTLSDGLFGNSSN